MKKIAIRLMSLAIFTCVVFMFALPASANPSIQSQPNAESSTIAVTQTIYPLNWAKRLVATIESKNNIYGSNPTYIKWKDVEGATVSENRTVCSSFITRLLKRTYGYTTSEIENWTGANNPKAVTYYNTITKQRHFQIINSVSDIQPGDLLAIKYSENAQSGEDEDDPNVDKNLLSNTQCPKRSSSTGHIVLIRNVPTVRKSWPPIQQDLTQYSLNVVDSSKSGHGCHDTRLLKNKSCSDKDAWGNGGVGQGTMRLYVDQVGTISGYSWSLRSQSTYYSQSGYEDKQGCQIPAHPLVVGRLSQAWLKTG